jgi:S1-C subfamily serine protease
MKRTLLEILAGLAVLVLLASFHHQIARLQVHDQDVAEMRTMLERAVANASSKQEILAVRQQLMARLENRLKELEVKVSEAALSSAESQKLKDELQAARKETEAMKLEIARDIHRTRELVDAYHTEMKAKETAAQAGILKAHDAIESLAVKVQPDPRTLTAQMLLPTVQLNGDDTVGSGTLVFSGKNAKNGQHETYVLTAYHVVRNILADSPSARRDGIAITIYQETEKTEARGDMIVHDERIDSALVKLRGEQVFPLVARVVAKEKADAVKVWDDVYAVGCPLGNDPIPTRGEISCTKNELNGSNYWMVNAPTYFGNSGGGVYLAGTRELIGVFSKIYTHGKGNPVVVPHMGLCTPISAVYSWLEKEKLEFVLQQDVPGLAAPCK